MFEAASLKLKWADKHIRDMEAAFHGFVHSKPYALGINRQSSPHYIAVVVKRPEPPEMGLHLGDAIHALRTVLDYATWDLLGIEGGTQDRFAKFPTGNTRVSFEASARGMKTPVEAFKDFFVKQEVFPGGRGDALYRLNQLDNVGKHRIITPVTSVSALHNVTFVDTTMGNRMQIGRIEALKNGHALLRFDPGSTFEIENDYDVSAAIFFGEIEGAPNEPVVPVLTQMKDAVAKCLSEFRDLVSSRG